jgi:hypothetical protein
MTVVVRPMVLLGAALAGLLVPGTARPNGTSVDMMAVLDLSGSMEKAYHGEHYSDVIQWIAEMGSAEDRIGVVTFGNGSREAQALTSLGSFRPETLQGKLKGRERWSDISSGLELAYYQLKTQGHAAARWVLLFSDGEIDLAAGVGAVRASERYLRDVLLPAMKREHIRVFAFMPGGLSADYPFLQEVAEATGGAYFRGLPEAAAGFRGARLAAIENESLGAAPDKAGGARAESAPPAKAPSAERGSKGQGPSATAIALGVGVGLALLILAAVVVGKTILRSRRLQRDLGGILGEVQILQDELVRAKARGDMSAEGMAENGNSEPRRTGK